MEWIGSTNTFADRVANNPGGFFASCLAVIPVTIAGVWIIRAMVDRDVDFGVGIIAIIGLIFLVFLINDPPYPWMSLVLLALLVVGMISVPIIDRLRNKATMGALDAEVLESTYARLRLNPKDFLTTAQLAYHLERLGLRGYAVVIMRQAIATAPSGTLTNEGIALRQWERELQPMHSVRCVCGTVPDPAELFCPTCRRAYLLEHVQRQTHTQRSILQQVLGWGLGLLLILLMIGSTAYGPTAIMITVPLGLLVGGLLFWRIRQEGVA